MHASDEQGWTPLRYAVLHGSGSLLDVVGELVEQGVDIEAPITGAHPHSMHHPSFTILFSAVMHSSPAMVRLLLKNGAKIAATATDGLTPLHMACVSDRPDTLAVLLEFLSLAQNPSSSGQGIEGTDVGRKTEREEEASVGKGRKDKKSGDSRRVTSPHAILNAKTTFEHHTPLHSACLYGSYGCVQRLLHHGADASALSAEGCNALMLASRSAKAHPRIISLLLQAQSFPYTVTSSTENQHISPDFTFRVRRRSLLGWVSGNVRTARMMQGLRMVTGRTALHYAAMSGRLPLAQALVEHGANVEACDSMGYTPEDCCALYGPFPEVERTLIVASRKAMELRGGEEGEGDFSRPITSRRKSSRVRKSGRRIMSSAPP